MQNVYAPGRRRPQYRQKLQITAGTSENPSLRFVKTAGYDYSFGPEVQNYSYTLSLQPFKPLLTQLSQPHHRLNYLVEQGSILLRLPSQILQGKSRSCQPNIYLYKSSHSLFLLCPFEKFTALNNHRKLLLFAFDPASNQVPHFRLLTTSTVDVEL